MDPFPLAGLFCLASLGEDALVLLVPTEGIQFSEEEEEEKGEEKGEEVLV